RKKRPEAALKEWKMNPRKWASIAGEKRDRERYVEQRRVARAQIANKNKSVEKKKPRAISKPRAQIANKKKSVEKKKPRAISKPRREQQKTTRRIKAPHSVDTTRRALTEKKKK
ncbi:MAG: hypothetical protein MK159_04670, partial [Halobacteriales archaeon]|nr:hypothetical protein [Halobacteriales archaeon]